MVEYSKVKVKLSDSQLNRLKSASKRSDRSNVKNEYQNVWWKKFNSWIIIDSKTKKMLENAFENSMSTDMKLSKRQISKIIQSR